MYLMMFVNLFLSYLNFLVFEIDFSTNICDTQGSEVSRTYFFPFAFAWRIFSLFNWILSKSLGVKAALTQLLLINYKRFFPFLFGKKPWRSCNGKIIHFEEIVEFLHWNFFINIFSRTWPQVYLECFSQNY